MMIMARDDENRDSFLNASSNSLDIDPTVLL
jgi:hypothetical protein